MGFPTVPRKSHHPGRTSSLPNAGFLGLDRATICRSLEMPWLFVTDSGGLLASIPAFPSVLRSIQLINHEPKWKAKAHGQVKENP